MMTPSDYHFMFLCNVTSWSIAIAALLLAWAALRHKVNPGKKLRKRVKALEDDIETLSDELDDHTHRVPDSASMFVSQSWEMPQDEALAKRLDALEAWRAHCETNAKAAGEILDEAEDHLAPYHLVDGTCDGCRYNSERICLHISGPPCPNGRCSHFTPTEDD